MADLLFGGFVKDTAAAGDLYCPGDDDPLEKGDGGGCIAVHDEPLELDDLGGLELEPDKARSWFGVHGKSP